MALADKFLERRKSRHQAGGIYTDTGEPANKYGEAKVKLLNYLDKYFKKKQEVKDGRNN